MVVRLFAPWIGGMERQALRLARALADRGCSVEIVTGRWYRGTPASEVVDGIPVIRTETLWEGFGVRGLRRLGGYAFMGSLAAHLWRTRDRYDVIHVHGLNYHTAVASIVGRRVQRPTVVKLANSGTASDIDKMRTGKLLASSGALVPAALRCDRFVATTDAVRVDLLAAGVEARRIVSIPNGIDMHPMPARSPTLHVPAEILFVGRLHEQKGVDILIRALSLVLDRRPAWRVRLRVVGDGPERASLEGLARELRVDGSVTFEGAHADVGPFLDAADLFVLPSRAEGLSNALLEAMARGLPVVVSAIAANAEVVRDGGDGLLFDPEDPEHLASVLIRSLGAESLRDRIGRRARLSVGERFAIHEVAERYLRLYGQLVGTDLVPGRPLAADASEVSA